MNFIVSSKELYILCTKVAPASAANGIIPILASFKMKVYDGVLTVTATDLENTVMRSMEVISNDNFDFCVDVKLLSDTLKSIPEQPITIDVGESLDLLTIITTQGKYSTAILSSSAFPTIEDEPCEAIHFDASIIDSLKSVKSLATNDELRMALTGILFEISDNKLTMVATDAHSLGLSSKKIVQLQNDLSVIVNPNMYKHLANNYSRGDLYLCFGERNLVIKLDDGSKIYSQLIDAKYPNYRAIIPQDQNKYLTIDSRTLLGAIDRISLFSNKTTYAVTLDINEDGTVLLKGEDLDFNNQAFEYINGDYDGDSINIALNAKFCHKIISLMADGDITISMSEYNKAVMFYSQNSSTKYLLMPVMQG